jgi:uncharacterized membrane protein
MTDALRRDALRVLNQHSVTLPTDAINLAAIRQLLDPLIFDGNVCRDDVAEICQKIDDSVRSEHDDKEEGKESPRSE